MSTPEPVSDPTGEAALAGQWQRGLRGPLRLADGRPFQVIFPGVPGGGAGPDFRDAILDAGGDLLRGDVEIHLETDGWRAHGHATDPAYANVVLHVVGEHRSASVATLHASGRIIPILVLPPLEVPFPPPFTPPCAIAVAGGLDPVPALERLAARRLRQKTVQATTAVARHGTAQALYTALLEILGGPVNRTGFATIAAQLPLTALLERVEGVTDRPAALGAHLNAIAAPMPLRRAGLRPAARPERRLDAMGRLLHRFWPAAADPGWPAVLAALAPNTRASHLLRAVQIDGIGRSMAAEIWTNAILPVGVASATMDDAVALARLRQLPAPATYGLLRPLEHWLGSRVFRSVGRLQGGLLLHRDYCARGHCGRCPLSAGTPSGVP